ncbi:MAG: enoyl-CoA hydratase-related protein [Syntrophomonadaceae bacterium]|nr:enoyl-CoA hydratase-related protein [Syntrophomonadaceae bacterium]MDH7497052.1 enoyl-CoA hydratase-related protein [Syntrophomonadaceae bacterium]
MELTTVRYDKGDGLAVITLNRPKMLNALDDRFFQELSWLMDDIAADQEVKAVIITGSPKVFAAGGDIAFMAAADPLQAQQFTELIRDVFEKFRRLDKPIVAAVSGMALGGGCELALACDLRIAAEGTVFGQPEINLGIIPGAGGTQRLTRTVGPGWAKHLIMTGLPIDADTALRIGLVTAVVPREELMEEARKLAGILGSKAPVAMKAAKNCIDMALDADLSAGLNYELKAFSHLFATADQKEGMQAFLEKRPPRFTGT